MDPNLSNLSADQLKDIIHGKEITSTTTPPVDPAVPPATPPAEPVTSPAAPAPGTPPVPAVPPSSDSVPPANPPVDPATPPTPDPAPPMVDFAAISGGRIKTQDEFQAYLANQDKLQQQLIELQNQSTFKSDKAKKLFELANQIDGLPLDAAMHVMRVQSLNLEQLQGQQLRFEAFKMKPEITSSGLSQDEIRTLFMESDRQKFGDPNDQENPPSEYQKIQEKLETNSARTQLAKIQENFNSAQGGYKSPEQIARENAEYRNFVQTQLATFQGVSLNLSAQDSDGEKVSGKVNYVLNAANQLPKVVELVSSPMEWWDTKLTERGIMDASGKIDHQKFADFATRIELLDELANSAYKQGREDMLAKMIKTHRNPSTPTDPNPAPPAPPAKAVNPMNEMAKSVFQTAGM